MVSWQHFQHLKFQMFEPSYNASCQQALFGLAGPTEPAALSEGQGSPFLCVACLAPTVLGVLSAWRWVKKKECGQEEPPATARLI